MVNYSEVRVKNYVIDDRTLLFIAREMSKGQACIIVVLISIDC